MKTVGVDPGPTQQNGVEALDVFGPNGAAAVDGKELEVGLLLEVGDAEVRVYGAPVRLHDLFVHSDAKFCHRLLSS